MVLHGLPTPTLQSQIFVHTHTCKYVCFPLIDPVSCIWSSQLEVACTHCNTGDILHAFVVAFLCDFLMFPYKATCSNGGSKTWRGEANASPLGSWFLLCFRSAPFGDVIVLTSRCSLFSSISNSLLPSHCFWSVPFPVSVIWQTKFPLLSCVMMEACLHVALSQTNKQNYWFCNSRRLYWWIH